MTQSFTARKVAEILALHTVSRDIACIKPQSFQQDEAFKAAGEQGKALIRHFEDHRRHVLETIAEQHPEVLDAI